jgi:hypothetical protein
MMTDQHICRTHGWVSSLTPCQDCLEQPEPRDYTAHNLVIDRQAGVVAEYKHQSARALAINAARLNEGAA